MALLPPVHSASEIGVEKSTEKVEVEGEKEMPEYLRYMYEKACKHLDQVQSEKVKQLFPEVSGHLYSPRFTFRQGITSKT